MVSDRITAVSIIQRFMHMSRWQFPFKTKAEARQYLKQAKKDTGERYHVFEVNYKVTIYKLFKNEADFKNYLKNKKNKFLRPIIKR